MKIGPKIVALKAGENLKIDTLKYWTKKVFDDYVVIVICTCSISTYRPIFRN